MIIKLKILKPIQPKCFKSWLKPSDFLTLNPKRLAYLAKVLFGQIGTHIRRNCIAHHIRVDRRYLIPMGNNIWTSARLNHQYIRAMSDHEPKRYGKTLSNRIFFTEALRNKYEPEPFQDLYYKFESVPEVCNYVAKKMGWEVIATREDSERYIFEFKPDGCMTIMKDADLRKLPLDLATEFMRWSLMARNRTAQAFDPFDL